MKAIMVMYDSLNREMLEPYGCDWISTPNFRRLAENAVTFDRNYVASMPCMPARRELHTGRYNFEHRSWGPLEPFDDSMPEILKEHGVYTHLTTDHGHYWEDGGATYHSRYSSFDLNRGQEGDHWKVNRELIQAVHQSAVPGRVNYYDLANREYMDCEEKMPQAQTFSAGLEFIEKHHDEDRWFLQIETFDPHEPFFTQEAYKKAFAHEYEGELGDWPPYYPVTEGEDGVKHMRMEYAALITMCDHYLGKVLDLMDKHDLWKDTMLIVNTDHGFLLGEHGWWSKTVMPVYEEISHTPLFIYDPRFPSVCGERRDMLTQIIDIPATLLEYFGVDLPRDMQGKPLKGAVGHGEKIRDYALFGYHEAHCNITDGEWVYMKAPLPGTKFYEYTLMPTHMQRCRTMKIQAQQGMNDPVNFGTKLFHLADDPKQEHPLENVKKETELANAMIRMMHEDDCPKERFARFGFPAEGEITEEEIEELHKGEAQDRIPEMMKEYTWERGAANMYYAVKRFIPEAELEEKENRLKDLVQDAHVAIPLMFQWVQTALEPGQQPMAFYFGMMASRTE